MHTGIQLNFSGSLTTWLCEYHFLSVNYVQLCKHTVQEHFSFTQIQSAWSLLKHTQCAMTNSDPERSWTHGLHNYLLNQSMRQTGLPLFAYNSQCVKPLTESKDPYSQYMLLPAIKGLTDTAFMILHDGGLPACSLCLKNEWCQHIT